MLMSIKNKLKSKGDTLCHSIPVQIDAAQQMKFFIKDFFSKCDQIRRKLPLWSNLLKKSIMENFFFFAV